MNSNTKANPVKNHDEKKTATPVAAKTNSDCCAHIHDGKIVSLNGSMLVMSGHDGKECSHTVAADAKVTCDGAACRTEDLKTGAKIRLTTRDGDKSVATKIESLNKQAAFAPSC